MKLVDIGVNLTNKQFAHDQTQVVDDAIIANIRKIIVTGTSEKSSLKAQLLAQGFPDVVCSTAGIHPHDAKDASINFTTVLADLYTHQSTVAIGECGLDFNRDFSPRPVQERVFEQQIELAAELNAPLFMHQRDAHKRFIEIVRPYANKINKAVVHCFTGSDDELEDYLALGFYIGITGWICDERRGLDVRALTEKMGL